MAMGTAHGNVAPYPVKLPGCTATTDDFIASFATCILCRASPNISSNLRVKIRKASKLSMVRSQSSHQTRRSDRL
jgi:hypothetical protein